MRKRLYLAGSGLMALTAIGLWLVLGTPTPHTTIRLWGKEGLPFTGRIKAGGQVFRVSSHLPAEFIVPGGSVECLFKKTKQEGTLGIRILSENGGTFQETYTDHPRGGVRGRVAVTLFKFGNVAKCEKRESTVTIFED
jgi:hypothetical protein